tara:strand:+ start:4461 stop:5111 length:651 start_codon:yes stop_codon:yes gene_type:complete
MNKTAIYIRTSTEEQTPELQLQDCLKVHYVNKQVDYKVFEDKQSAWKDNKERVSFETLKKEIKQKKFNNLIVWDLDRIYRNRKKLISFFEYCKIYDCKIHSYRQQWLESLNSIEPPFNDIMFDLMLQIMGWLAEEESNKKSERVKLAVSKRGGVTRSKYGNKWGRKTISTYKINQIHNFYNSDLSMRQIAKEVGVSKSVVHKTLRELKEKKGLKLG